MQTTYKHPLMSHIMSHKNQILLVSEEHSQNFLTDLNARLSDPLLATESGRLEATKAAMSMLGGLFNGERMYAQDGNKAIIPVHGALVNRLNSTYGFVTGYAYIKGAIKQAVADPTIETIVLDVNSNGGEVAGCWETVAFIREAAQTKPIHAIVDTNCYSAAYAISSAATSITATPSAGVGSIGVIAIHADVSKMYEDAGIKLTIVQAGKFKSLGSPFKELSDEDREILQSKINASYDEFTSTVAANRNIDKETVIKTEAACYTSNQALALGLIDRVEAAEKAYASLSTVKKEDDTMSVEQNANMTASNDNGAAAERQRIQAILGAPAAQANPNLAQHLAFATAMSAEEAQAMLAAASKDDEDKKKKSESEEKKTAEDDTSEEKKPAKDEKAAAEEPNMLAAAMAKIENPNVGADNAASNEVVEAAEIESLAAIANKQV